MKRSALPLVLLLALAAWFLFGKRALVTSRVAGYSDPRCPYWVMKGESWEGLQGEQVPIIRDWQGIPLTPPPDPPWSPCYA